MLLGKLIWYIDKFVSWLFPETNLDSWNTKHLAGCRDSSDVKRLARANQKRQMRARKLRRIK
jgi:hypothetical protein